MKKSMLFLVAAACSCALLSAQGNTEGQMSKNVEKKPVLLRLWGGVPGEYGPQQTVDKFNEEFKDKGIQAEYVRFVNDDTGNMKLETTLLGGGDVDLFLTYTTANLVKRGTGGMSLELSGKLQQAGFDMVKELGDGVKPYIYDGKVYGVPTKMENYFILANKNMFDEAGIPLPQKGWTYDDFREIAKKLTHGEGQDKVYGMYWNTNMEISRPSYLAQAVLGPNFLYKEGGKESNLDNPELVKVNQLVSDMMNVDKSAVSHTDNVTQKLSIESQFLGGKAAMSLGVWAIRSIKNKEKYPHDFVTAYLPPPVSDPAKAQYSIGEGVVGDFLCINTKSTHIDEAFQFLLWYVRGGMLPMAPYGRVPLYTGIDPQVKLDAYLQNGEGILDPPTVSKFLENLPNMAVSTETNHLPEVSKVYNDALEEIYTGRGDAKDVLSKAKAKADMFLK